MKINLDKLPNNLDEAVDMLVESLTAQERVEATQAAKTDEALSDCHFGLGMWVRNNWNLWDDSPLTRWFVDNLKITHADDMSGLIMEAFAAKLIGRPYNPAPTVDRYHAHWRRSMGKKAVETMIDDWHKRFPK